MDIDRVALVAVAWLATYVLHSTVLHGYEKISREVNENTALRKEVLAIRQQLFG